MFEGLFQRISDWRTAAVGYGSLGYMAPIKFFAPSLANFQQLTIGQRNTFDQIANAGLKNHIQGGNQADAIIVLNAIANNPSLLHIWEVLEVNAGNGALHFARFLTLSAQEAQTYLSIITGVNDGSQTATAPNRANLKPALFALPANKMKDFLAEFATAPAATFDSLNAQAILLTHWQNLSLVNPTTVPQNRKIEFLKGIEYLTNSVQGQATCHHIMQGDYDLNTHGVKGIKGVHHINAIRQAVGGMDTVGDVRVTGVPIILGNGFYQQQVQVYTWQNVWKNKTGNGGLASFFPDAWTAAQVIEEIAFAEANALYQENVDIHIDEDIAMPMPPAVAFQTSGVLVIDVNNLSTANLVGTAGNTDITNTPLLTHPQGQTHNAKVSVPIAVSVDVCPAVLTTPSTGTVTFLGSTYTGTTTSGNACQFYLYNPNHATKIIGSAFPI